MEWVLLFIAAVFTAMAAAECFLDFRAMRRTYRSDNGRMYLLIPLTPDMTDTENILREALDMAHRSLSPCHVLLCDMDAGEETLEICRRFSKECRLFEICSGDRAKQLLGLL